MRETNRKYLLKRRKKLMNTTTFFVALLIAATLVLSSAVSAKMMAPDNSTRMNNVNDDLAQVTTVKELDNSMPTIADVCPYPRSSQPLGEPGDLLFEYDVEGPTGDIQCLGVEFDGEFFWVTGGFNGGEPNKLYKFDADGNLDETYDQPSHTSGWGWRDLAYLPDEGLLYSGYGSYLIDEIDATTGEWTGNQVPGPLATCRAIAYRPDTDTFFTADWASNIYEIDREGNIVEQYSNTLSLYGLAYDEVSDDGPWFWGYSQDGSGPWVQISQLDPTTLEQTGVYYEGVYYSTGDMAGGCCFIENWEGYGTFCGLTQNTPDLIFGYEICDAIPKEHDIGVKSIVAPEDGPATEIVVPEVLVKNYGNNTETADVQFEIIKCEAGPLLLEENFTGTWPPAGWTHLGWEQSDTEYAVGEEKPEAYYGYYSGHYVSYGWIMSPPVNCSGYEKVNVKFRLFGDMSESYSPYFYVEYRKNSTSAWKDVSPWTNPVSGDLGPWPYEIGCYGWGGDIGNEFQVRWRFGNYYYYLQYNSGIYLDDVVIEGCAGCAEYAKLEEDVEIPVGEEVTVYFPDWTPSEWHNPDFEDTWEEYPLTSYTILKGFVDENPRNDKKQRLLSLYYPFLHDVEVQGVYGPERGPAQTFPMETTIKNVGQYDECCFKTHAQVAELDMGTSDVLLTEDFYPYTQFPPTGWTRTNTKWRGYYSNYCGAGDYAEARFYYSPSETGVFRLYTPPIDTSDYGAVEIQWINYLNHYSGPYTIKVETSPDGLTWSTVWEVVNPGNMPAETMTVVTGDNVGSSTFHVSWTFDGYSWNVNWWHLDNVVIKGFPLAEPEYYDFVCIDKIEDGEEQDLVFDDWTPEFLAEGKTGTKIYSCKIWTDDPEDTNHANDAFAISVELEFFHDVGIREVTKPPVGSADRLDWIQYSDETIENALGLTSAPSVITEAIKLTPTELGPYENHEITRIRVCKGYPGYNYAHDFEVWIYTGAQPTNPDAGTIVATGTSPVNYGWFEIDTEDYPFAPTDTLWVGVNWDHFAVSTFPCSMDSSISIAGKSRWYTYDLGTGWYPWYEYSGYSFMIGAGVEEAGADVYVQPGLSNIQAILENLGTFPEYDMTCYAEMYEFYTNCSDPQLCYTDNKTGIKIEEPLTGTETINFKDYDFAVEGPYRLYLELVLPLVGDVEKDLKNNLLNLGIGCDATPPTSSHTLDPPTPDGLNGWYVSDVTVTVTAEDPMIGCGWVGSGVKEIRYTINGDPGTVPGDSGTFVIHDDGDDILVEYWAVDYVENEESPKHTFTIDMDQTKPEIDGRWDAELREGKWFVIFTINATDAMSGMDRVKMYINEGFHKEEVHAGPVYVFEIQWSPDFKSVLFKFEAHDFAGWTESIIIPGDVIEPHPYSKPKSISQSQTITVQNILQQRVPIPK